MPAALVSLYGCDVDQIAAGVSPRSSSFEPCTVVWYGGPQFKPYELRVNERAEVVAANIEAGAKPGAKFIHPGGDAYVEDGRVIFALEGC